MGHFDIFWALNDKVQTTSAEIFKVHLIHIQKISLLRIFFFLLSAPISRKVCKGGRSGYLLGALTKKKISGGKLFSFLFQLIPLLKNL